MTSPRVPPGRFRDVGPLAWAIAHGGGLASRSEPLTLFLTLGRHRKLFGRWLLFASRLMPRGSLPRADTELVILRVAHLRECGYERHHHERIARRSGLRPAQIDATRDGLDSVAWLPRQRVILRAVDALVERGDLDDDEWADLHRHLDDRQCIEFCLLVGHYEMLATTINTLRVQPERPRARRRG